MTHNPSNANFFQTLPHAWSGKDERGLYCCSSCWGTREVTFVTPDTHLNAMTGLWLNQKQVDCPACKGAGGVAERRKGDRRQPYRRLERVVEAARVVNGGLNVYSFRHPEWDLLGAALAELDSNEVKK